MEGVHSHVTDDCSIIFKKFEMKNRPVSENSIVSEWENNILFDADDPDFCNIPPNVANVVLNSSSSTNTTTLLSSSLGATSELHFKVPLTNTNSVLRTTTTTSATMSLASVHGPQFNDICSPLGRSSISISSSLNDLVGSPLEISVDNVLTIEELRQQMGSCFTCGVSWTDDHVSLDCSECGGYSLERPCPLCDGKCNVQWKRDFTMSHACGKARWLGVCPSYPEVAMHLTAPATNSSTCASAASQLRLAQDLCARLEQLSAHT